METLHAMNALTLYRGTLSYESRLEYINAVKCLQKKAPRTLTSDAPGVRSRFDDFVYMHIKQTPIVHFSVSFLSNLKYSS